jgi:arylsulfatase A-like enzyme
MVTRLDTDIGRLLDKLRELGLDDNTLVLLTSDNGPHKEGGHDPGFFASGGGLRGIKRDLYEGGIRVPGIARWPKKIAAGATNDLPVAHWDVLPTLAELAGGKTPKGLDGLSIVPTLLGDGREQPTHNFLYWEFFEGGFRQAVRHGQWKAVQARTQAPIELYDLANDPGEQRELSAEQPEVMGRIKAYLERARTESPHWPRERKR